MTLVKFRNPNSLAHHFEDFFKTEAFNGMEQVQPAVNIKEEDQRYLLEVSAPGYRKDSFQISVDDDTLTVKGAIEVDEEHSTAKYISREFRSSSFKRSFKLGGKVNTDQVSATYENGILIVDLPKVQQEIKRTKEVVVA